MNTPLKLKSRSRIKVGILEITFSNVAIISILFQAVIIDPVVSSGSCARLQSRALPSYANNSLKIRRGCVIGNLAEEYLTAEKSWNVSAYWMVDSSCELKACDDVYLNGNCKTFSNGISSPVERWLSAECKCSRNCQCTDIHLKQSVCARAYLQPGSGCDSCDAPYIELVPKKEDLEPFSAKWSDKVVSFLVRKGCTLSIYEGVDEDEELVETIEGPTYKEWATTTSVSSYNCDCNDDGYVEEKVIIPTATDIPSVAVQSTLDDVITKFSEHNFDHPGLLAAFTSLMHRRSSKNAYILTIGTSGAGKSSGINALLGTKNLTVTGDQESTTSEILEYRISLPLPEIGISNSELRIIDTPGLGDTRGLTNDAMFLATLDDYLNAHEELRTRIPNLVLIFHKFTDNRFDGESAKFVRMIRGLDAFRTRITDENYSNVLFIFSHFCAVPPQFQKNPHLRLMKFKEVIEKYSLFPKPIVTSVIENKGDDNALLLRNGNYELPNGEYFPQNLLQKFETVTRNGMDKIGAAVIDAAFRQKRLGEKVTAKLIKYDLISSATHSKVTKYFNILAAASDNIGNTQISKSLDEAYKTMSSSLKTRYPNCLKDLQRNLHIRNIHSQTDLPQTGLAILELLNELGQNDANMYLFEHGLHLKAPSFPSTTVAGYSYSLVKDSFVTCDTF